MSGYQVIVTEHRSRGLVDSDGASYVSPSQTEGQARSLIAFLAGATSAAGGAGSWRQPVAGGQRVIDMERQR